MSETSERTKRCIGCRQEKSRESFSRFSWRCRPCDALRVREARARRRAAGPPPGECSCCGTADPGSKIGWVLDHDHGTGATRAWTCSPCNTGLGSLKDSPTVLAAAIRYLHRHGKALSSDDLASLLQLNTS